MRRRERVADRATQEGREDQEFAVVAGNPAQRVQDPVVVQRWRNQRQQAWQEERDNATVVAGQRGGSLRQSVGGEVRGRQAGVQEELGRAVARTQRQGLGRHGSASAGEVEDRARVFEKIGADYDQ